MIPVEDILGAGDHQGVAIAGGILAAVVALFIAIDKGRTAHMQKRWEEVCRRTLQARDSRQHKVLKSGDANKVGHGWWAVTVLCRSCAFFLRHSMGCGRFAHGGTFPQRTSPSSVRTSVPWLKAERGHLQLPPTVVFFGPNGVRRVECLGLL